MTASSSSELNTTYDTFQVGNGAFAFNADVTGLQSFNSSYSHFGVNTLADWMWHSTPFNNNKSDPAAALRAYNFSIYNTPVDGRGTTRTVPYVNDAGNSPDVAQWMMDNPHRLNLGQTSLRLWSAGANTTSLQIGSIVNASQRLSLWQGLLDSNFTVASSTADATCSLTQDNSQAEFSCGPGAVITGGWASYGRPTGSCESGFTPAASCMSPNSSKALASLCVGKPSCAFIVNYRAGFGDPCPGVAKWLAGNVTCSAPPPPPPSPFSVRVRTVSDPDIDLVALRIECTSAGPCNLAVRIAFPYGATSGSDWERDVDHTTTIVQQTDDSLTLLRELDSDSYTVKCSWDGGLDVVRAHGLAHAFDFTPPRGGLVAASISCLYAPLRASGELRFPVGADTPWLIAKASLTAAALDAPHLPLFPLVYAAAALSWQSFWEGGAFLDLASRQGPGTPAWELERRVVLSRYVMRVNNAGAEPPQETGLLCNSWGGKHHNEMRFWHLAHWALWGDAGLMARSDAFFFEQLQNATAFASFEGYAGAHWPKETGAVANRTASGIDVPWLGLDHALWPFGGSPNGTLLVWESPQVDNALVIWQQPHLILMAELQRRAAESAGGAPAAAAVVNRLLPLVSASADYLAARMYLNESDGGGTGRFMLGPPVIGGQEMGDPTQTYNPTFELVYIGQSLDLAAAWRAAGGLPSNPLYEAVASSLTALPTDPASPPDGPPLYVFDARCVCMYLDGGTSNSTCRAEWVPPTGSNCRSLEAHPLVVAPVGMLNGIGAGARYGVDAASANATLAAVWANWALWKGSWGWDDGLLAMSMARLGWSADTIWTGPLLDPKFPYYKNGHTLCCPAYLPGNGALLLAVGVLAGGTDTSQGNLFPVEWGVVAEGFEVKYP